MSSTTNSPLRMSTAVDLAPIDLHHKVDPLSFDVPSSAPADTITASMKKMHFYAIHVLHSLHAQGKLIDMDPLSLDILLLHSFDPKHIQLLLKQDKKHTKALKIVPSHRENIAAALATDFYQQDPTSTTTTTQHVPKIKRKYTKKNATPSPPTDSLVQDIVLASQALPKKATKPRAKKQSLVQEAPPAVPQEAPKIKRKYTKKTPTEKPVPPSLPLTLTEELVAEPMVPPPVPELPQSQPQEQEPVQDQDQDQEEEEPIQGRLITFQDQSYLLDAAQRVYHPTTFVHLGHLDLLTQSIVFL